MRLQLHLSPNTEPVPFNHLHQLTGSLHKWLGPNNIHDGMSLYSFGWLRGAKRKNDHLTFPEGATWNVSFQDDIEAKQLLQGILKDSAICNGIRVVEVEAMPAPAFGNFYRFRTDGSSIVARRLREDGSREYLYWNNPDADNVLTQLLRRKLSMRGYEGEHLEVQVRFDRTYTHARTRKITIKGTEHKGSECPVWVAGTPEAVQFAWLVGLGDLTGSGFGGIY